MSFLLDLPEPHLLTAAKTLQGSDYLAFVLLGREHY